MNVKYYVILNSNKIVVVVLSLKFEIITWNYLTLRQHSNISRKYVIH